MGAPTSVLKQEHGTYVVPAVKMNRGLRPHQLFVALNPAEGFRQVQLSGPGQQSSLSTMNPYQCVRSRKGQRGHRRPMLLQLRANPRYGIRPLHRTEESGSRGRSRQQGRRAHPGRILDFLRQEVQDSARVCTTRLVQNLRKSRPEAQAPACRRRPREAKQQSAAVHARF